MGEGQEEEGEEHHTIGALPRLHMSAVPHRD